VAPDLARELGEDLVAVVELDPKVTALRDQDDFAVEMNQLFLLTAPSGGPVLALGTSRKALLARDHLRRGSPAPRATGGGSISISGLITAAALDGDVRVRAFGAHLFRGRACTSVPRSQAVWAALRAAPPARTACRGSRLVLRQPDPFARPGCRSSGGGSCAHAPPAPPFRMAAAPRGVHRAARTSTTSSRPAAYQISGTSCASDCWRPDLRCR
jgi:hypothetical protein